MNNENTTEERLGRLERWRREIQRQVDEAEQDRAEQQASTAAAIAALESRVDGLATWSEVLKCVEARPGSVAALREKVDGLRADLANFEEAVDRSWRDSEAASRAQGIADGEKALAVMDELFRLRADVERLLAAVPSAARPDRESDAQPDAGPVDLAAQVADARATCWHNRFGGGPRCTRPATWLAPKSPQLAGWRACDEHRLETDVRIPESGADQVDGPADEQKTAWSPSDDEPDAQLVVDRQAVAEALAHLEGVTSLTHDVREARRLLRGALR